MAKISLGTKVKLDFTDEGKVFKTFNVTYRELGRKQTKSIGKENKDIMDVFTKGQSLVKRSEVLEAKVAALKELNKADDLLSTTNKLDTLYDEQDVIEEKFEELGGIDKLLEASKLTYDLAVGGKDKDILSEFAETESEYSTVLNALKEDAQSQSGNGK